MRERLNCPNCGAPITDVECPYCGTIFYDFATLDYAKPTYIRMVWNDQIITSRVMMISASINIEHDALPAIKIEFMAVPDDNGVTIRQERRINHG